MDSLEDCEVAFQQFSQNGALSVASVAQAARRAGACPSIAEVEEFKKQIGDAGCSLTTFKTFCEKTLHKEDDRKDIGELFRSKISRTSLKMLQKFGEPLTDVEFDAVVKEFSQRDSEEIDYVTLLARVFHQ